MSLESEESRSNPAGSLAGQGAHAPGGSKIKKRFVILATPRSGSSHLVDLLDSHPELSCTGELYNPHGAALRKLGLRNKEAMTQAGQEPIQFLDRVQAQLEAEDGCKPYFGFKLMLHHDPRMIDYVLNDPRWTVIVLERRDLVAQWTSAGLAKKTGRWGTSTVKKRGSDAKEADDDADDDNEDETAEDGAEVAKSSGTESPKVVFNAQKFEAYCFRMEARYASIYHRLGQRPYFRLFSEEIDASHPDLLNFLGAAPRPLESTRPRQNSSSMRDRIKNYNSYVRYAKRHSLPVT